MTRFRTRLLSVATLAGLASVGLHSAALAQGGTTLSAQTNADRIPYAAVPFLTITPDARSAALGEAGVALSPTDANALFWNPAKLIFAPDHSGLSLSYTPWLRNLGLDDMWLSYLSGYKKLGNNQFIGLSLNYNNQGLIQFTNNVGTNIGQFNSYEVGAAATYGRRLSQRLALALSLRYINSNLAGDQVLNGIALKPGNTVAGDIGLYYHGNRERNTYWNFGALISNLGGRISYGGPNQSRNFIPTNLKLGTAVTTRLADQHSLTFTVDLNKLMVPTPPQYDPNNTGVILAGRDPAKLTTLGGIFGSFSDAPGGFSEELREFNQAIGAEYWYSDILAARVGFYNQPKGGYRFVTAGIGVHYSKYALDFAYLFPQGQNSPLANTLRLTLSIGFDKGTRVEEPGDDEE
jgi:hypothetical protein